ncbi:DUF4062 domain-containing protein [Vibrio parahaemolyticus]
MEFIRKRLQVFISSTFTDLINERQAAVEAILTAGHIPAGMELFTSGDESQMDVIKTWIDESDVYMVIIGGRYGSLEPKTLKSYTQLEYEYALEQGKPIFACVITDASQEQRVKEFGSSALEVENPQKMKDFRQLVLSKVVKFWDDAKDIKIVTGETLSHLARRDDLKGWVRESEQANLPALADEVARLSKENAELRERLTSSSNDDFKFSGLSFEKYFKLLSSKGLLDLVLEHKHREIFIKEFYEIEDFESKQLAELGLIGFFKTTKLDNWGDQLYTISEEGKTFLNFVDAEGLSLQLLKEKYE